MIWTFFNRVLDGMMSSLPESTANARNAEVTLRLAIKGISSPPKCRKRSVMNATKCHLTNLQKQKYDEREPIKRGILGVFNQNVV
jgi:hypothetical protein